MSSRNSTSRSRAGSTSHRLTHPPHAVRAEQLDSAARSVVHSNGPNAARVIFEHAVQQASRPPSSRSEVSHSGSLRSVGGNSGLDARSAEARPSHASSRSSARSPYSPTDPHASTPPSSYRSRSSSTSTYTPSHHSDGRSSSYHSPYLRRNTASAFIEPVPEEAGSYVRRSDETRRQHALVPVTYDTPAAHDTSTTWRHAYHPQTGVVTLSASQTQRDARGNTYLVNVVHNYPPPIIIQPAVVPVVPVCCFPGNECAYHRRFRR